MEADDDVVVVFETAATAAAAAAVIVLITDDAAVAPEDDDDDCNRVSFSITIFGFLAGFLIYGSKSDDTNVYRLSDYCSCSCSGSFYARK